MQDDDALKWLKWTRFAATEQGNADAQNSLGLRYSTGSGVPKDHLLAVKWYRLAAEQGYSIAQLNLGYNYDNGTGVPQDYALAHMWFNPSAAHGDADAIDFRDRVAQRMTPDQLAEAQRMAREWKPKPVGTRPASSG